MASGVPVKDLRPLADWRNELGLDRLTTDLTDGDLDTWWYDHATGKWHRIPREHWRQENAVEHAIGWGWRIGGGLFSSDVVRLCAIYAARPGPSATPTATDSHPGAAAQPPSKQRRTPPGWAQKEVIPKLREEYRPDGIPPEGTPVRKTCEAIGVDPERKWKTVDRAVKYLRHLRG
jgi:hypothetical protein